MKYLAAIGILLVSVEASAQELNNCAGVITNRPCDASVTSKPVTISSDAQIRSKRSLILHDLTMKSLRAKKAYGIDVDISRAQEICTNTASTVDACRDAAQILDDRIEDRVTARELVESKNKKNEKKDPTGPPSGVTTTTNEIIIIHNSRGYRSPGSFPPNRNQPPPYQPPHSSKPWHPEEFVPPPAVPRPSRMRLPNE